MSSLPLISHHLFVEAVGQEETPKPRPARQERTSVLLKGIATALPLELLDPSEPLAAENARPLRTTPCPGSA
jgi:hypothetical protein